MARKPHQLGNARSQVETKHFIQTAWTSVRPFEIEQLSINPPKHRDIIAQSADKITHLLHALYLETAMAAAKSLTPAELQRVLAHIETQAYAQRNRAMLMMTVAAGLRVSEVAGLTLGDVLDSTGAVRSEVFLAAHRVKHGHARTIFINSRLQQELADYIATRTHKDLSFPLFASHRGPRRHFSPNTLAQHFYWLYRKAGVTGASSHSGRKTFLTSLAGQGISVFVLAKLAGHRDIKTTMRYVTTSDDMLRKAVELV
ncbi:MAG: tyrosine-type recombinase/integrase [Limnohabitans sp.]